MALALPEPYTEAEGGPHEKLTALLLTGALALSLAAAGCGDLEALDEEESTAAEETARAANTRGLSMSVNNDTGELRLTRLALPDRGSSGEEGLWTIFVYLCGTDLESGNGGATDDMVEMLSGASGDGVRFVVETGGASEWQNETVDAGHIQRYLIEDEDIELVDQQRSASMGRPETFSSFLRWGAEQYPSEHMGVVLWNHGGGSITGVCFDETDDYNSLSLRDLDTAFLEACGGMGRKFDFVGFDACLMGTLETANILASYADYMIASEEMEPGSGWDYDAIGSYLVKHPGADTLSLGRTVCDSFQAACRQVGDEDICTLSVIDLSRLDSLLVAFNDFAHGMFDASSDTAVRADMVRGITKADSFGGNNKSEGYTNMVDVGGLISACEDYSDGAEAALDALADAVAYSVSGSAHQGASGLSLYYPLKVEGSQELSIFADICPSPYCISFVDRQAQGSADALYAEDYDEDEWFDEDGNWFWGLLGTLLSDGEEDDYEEWSDDHWGFLDDGEPTGESPLITFAVEPHVDEDGSFWFQLDENGYDYAADVYGVVYAYSPDGEDVIELGETYDLNGGWDTGVFADAFDGWWISLPDGQNLAVYIAEDAEDYTIYTSPVLLNGEETNLRLKLDYEAGTLTIEGAWDGVDESGALSRELVKLQPGDVITPLYYAYALEGDDEFYYQGEDYAFDGQPEIYYDVMADGDYCCAFCIDDIYGDYYLTDYAEFFIEDGETGFYAYED